MQFLLFSSPKCTQILATSVIWKGYWGQCVFACQIKKKTIKLINEKQDWERLKKINESKRTNDLAEYFQ